MTEDELKILNKKLEEESLFTFNEENKKLEEELEKNKKEAIERGKLEEIN